MADRDVTCGVLVRCEPDHPDGFSGDPVPGHWRFCGEPVKPYLARDSGQEAMCAAHSG